MLTSEIQGCCRDRGGWYFTTQVVGPLWTATSRARPCEDCSCDPSLPRPLVLHFGRSPHTASSSNG